MSQLIDAVRHFDRVAVSRLNDPAIATAIVAAGIEIIEIPHVRCRPVPHSIGSGTTRIRSWPNLGGYLEDGADDDIVLWDRSLAEAPPNGNLVIQGTDEGDVRKRTSVLGHIVKTMEQIKGVSACRSTTSPRAIVYTPGLELHALGPVTGAFPGAMSLTPAHLVEFPGGVILTLTREAWIRHETYAEAVDAVLSHRVGTGSDTR